MVDLDLFTIKRQALAMGLSVDVWTSPKGRRLFVVRPRIGKANHAFFIGQLSSCKAYLLGIQHGQTEGFEPIISIDSQALADDGFQLDDGVQDRYLPCPSDTPLT